VEDEPLIRKLDYSWTVTKDWFPAVLNPTIKAIFIHLHVVELSYKHSLGKAGDPVLC
jgi:hypothetical protein